MKKRGQVSMEFLFTAGIVLLALTGILAYSLRQSSTSISINEAGDAVNSLAAAADTVYAMGPGSEKYITVTLPGGTSGSYITGRTVGINVSIFGGTSEFHKRSRANLTGGIPDSRGTYRIQVKALDSGSVQLNNTG